MTVKIEAGKHGCAPEKSHFIRNGILLLLLLVFCSYNTIGAIDIQG